MSWTLGLTCPMCGERCSHVTGSQPGALGRHVSAIAECSSGHRWQVVVDLIPVGGQPVTVPR